MSRPIKFRVFDTVKKKMSEPFDLEDFAYDQDGERGPGDFSLGDWDKDNKRIVFPLMQFTGLHDKNGKEIYEGDILKNNDLTWIVEFWNAAFGIRQVGKLNGFLVMGEGEYSEVIGNIHENPELLPYSGEGGGR